MSTIQSQNNYTALIPYLNPEKVIFASVLRWRTEQQRIQKQKLDTLFCQTVQSPCIVYTKGSCSAGKTTLRKAIETQLQSWICIDDDCIEMEVYLSCIRNNFRHIYDVVNTVIAPHNLFHALFYNDFCFQENTSPNEQLAAKKAVSTMYNSEEYQTTQDAMYAGVCEKVIVDIKTALKEKKNVFLDSWFFTADKIQEYFPEIGVIRLMLYCPLSVAFTRLGRRNQICIEKRDFREKRYIKNLVRSFFSLYQLTTNGKGAIEDVFQNSIADECQKIKQAIQRQQGVEKKISVAEFQELQDQFLNSSPQNEEKQKILYISPKTKQDVIIHSEYL